MKEVVKLVWQNLTKTMYIIDHIQAVHFKILGDNVTHVR